MKLVMMEFVTLDGISQGPGSPDEDRSDGFTLGGWLVPFVDDAFLSQIQAWARKRMRISSAAAPIRSFPRRGRRWTTRMTPWPAA